MKFSHDLESFIEATGFTKEEFKEICSFFPGIVSTTSRKSRIVEALVKSILNKSDCLKSETTAKGKLIKMFVAGWLLAEHNHNMVSLNKSISSEIMTKLGLGDILSKMKSKENKSKPSSSDTEDFLDNDSEDPDPETSSFVEGMQKVIDGDKSRDSVIPLITMAHSSKSNINYKKVPDEIVEFFVEELVGCKDHNCEMAGTQCKIFNRYLQIKKD